MDAGGQPRALIPRPRSPETAERHTGPEYQPSLTAATRRLCAGTYLHADFRDEVLGGAYLDVRRRIAPSAGFDLVPVAVHAWRAWCLERWQHVRVLAVLGVAIVVAPLGAMAVVALLESWRTARHVRHRGRPSGAGQQSGTRLKNRRGR